MASTTLLGRLLRVLSALWQLRHLVSTTVDVLTDLILISQLWSRAVGWVLLGALVVSDFIATVRIHRFMMTQLRQGKAVATESSSPLAAWGRALLSFYASAARSGLLLRLLLCLLITPFVSATVLVLMLCMPFVSLYAVVLTDTVKEASWEFMGCLDVYKVVHSGGLH